MASESTFFWVHCNSCQSKWSPPGGKDQGADRKRFFVTSCAHILCQRCCEAAYKSGKICGICRSAGISFVEIGPGMPKVIQDMFVEVRRHLSTVYSAFQFQSAQAKSLVSLLTQRNRKCEDEKRVLEEKLRGQRGLIEELEQRLKDTENHDLSRPRSRHMDSTLGSAKSGSSARVTSITSKRLTLPPRPKIAVDLAAKAFQKVKQRSGSSAQGQPERKHHKKPAKSLPPSQISLFDVGPRMTSTPLIASKTTNYVIDPIKHQTKSNLPSTGSLAPKSKYFHY